MQSKCLHCDNNSGYIETDNNGPILKCKYAHEYRAVHKESGEMLYCRAHSMSEAVGRFIEENDLSYNEDNKHEIFFEFNVSVKR